MRDFTLEKYRALLSAALDGGFDTITYVEYLAEKEKQDSRRLIMRHDVDKRPDRSLRVAQLEKDMGVRATYYFRCVPCSYDETIMRQIESMGHEVGYHYEDLTLAKGNKRNAQSHFEMWVKKMRDIVRVRTVCMHGSPLSQFDNRLMWEGETQRQERYGALGLAGEPYFDTDWNDVEYLTDTGRCWDGDRFSRRDKVANGAGRKYALHSTDDLMNWLRQSDARTVMITTHPQRWTTGGLPWWKEFLTQNAKNVVKRFLC